MSTLNISDGNISNTTTTGNLTVNGVAISNSFTVGSVTVNTSQITVGNSLVNSSVVSVPSLILSGTTISGLFGAIVNTQIFTANGTWTNPTANATLGLTGYEQVLVMMWGGGGGGSNNNLSSRGGGGGGACVIGSFRVSDCNTVCNVVVGLGGSAGAVSTNGSSGTASIFWSNTTNSLSAYGGAGAYGAASVNPAGGGGGGWLSNGTIATTGGVGGSPLGGSGPSGNSTFGGGGGASTTLGTNGGTSIFGGGGGAGAGSSALGANSIYGGGGGAGSGNNIGVSVFGGNGGANSVLTAIVPGGGGSGTQNGARGEVRVWTISSTAGAPVYTLTANTTSLYEGSSIQYTASVTNLSGSTTLYYTLNNSSTATSSDFSTVVNGSVIISGGVGTFTLTANNDDGTTDEPFTIDLRAESSTGTIMASNNAASIISSPKLTFINKSFVALSGNTASHGSFTTSESGLLVVVELSRTSSTATAVSSATIGGSAATIEITNPKTIGYLCASIITREVAAGSHAVSIVYDNTGVQTSGVLVYLLTNYSSAVASDKAISIVDVVSGSQSLSDVTMPTKGIGIFGFAQQQSLDFTPTTSWTGVFEDQEFYDNVISNPISIHSAYIKTQGTPTVTATKNTSRTAIIGASWA